MSWMIPNWLVEMFRKTDKNIPNSRAYRGRKRKKGRRK